jgi:prepilin-type N-terminal cleavage/methylation domain-containing protein
MMHRIRKAMTEKEQGFTLIELLVVIIIFGILAAIAIPVFLNQRKKGVDANLKADVKNLATQITAAETDGGLVMWTGWVNPNNTPNANEQFLRQDLRLSPRNSVAVKGDGQGNYCIRASNPNSNFEGGVKDYVFYNSAAGGLQPADSEPSGPCV